MSQNGDVGSGSKNGGMYNGTMRGADTRHIAEGDTPLEDLAHEYVSSRVRQFIDDALAYDGVPVVVLPPKSVVIEREIFLPRRIKKSIGVHVPVIEIVEMLKQEYDVQVAREKTGIERLFEAVSSFSLRRNA